METPRKRGLEKQLSKTSYKKKWKKYVNNYLSVQGELPSPKLVHKMCTMEDTDDSDTLKRPKIEPELDVSLERSSRENSPDEASESSDHSKDDECRNKEQIDQKSTENNDDDDDDVSSDDVDQDENGEDVNQDDDDDDVEEDADDDTGSSSSSSDDESEKNDDTRNIDDKNNDIGLKPGMNKADILTSVSALAVQQGIALAATLDILKVFNLMSNDLKLPTTERDFFKAIAREDDPPTECHTYCRKCQAVIGVGTTPISDSTCCGICGPVEPPQENPFFVKVNIKSQLQTILAIPDIKKHLQYRFDRKKNREDGIEDVYDGIEYKRLSEPGRFLHSKWNYSIIMNIACWRLQKSVKAWPILLSINELPPELRKKNMILAGIWMNTIPPKVDSYFLPIFNELRSLYTTGMQWKPDGVNVLTSKFITIICLIGSEFRSDFLNLNKLNDAYDCAGCYAERAENKLRNDTVEATSTGEHIMSVIPEFNLMRGTVVDSMDVLFVGVAKDLTRLFICGPSTNPWYRGDRRSLKKINAVNLEPTGSIGRFEKTIESHKSWDATDWKHWLLYYSVPSLFRIIRSTDHKLLVMLSEAAHLVSGNTLTPSELKTARKLIQKFIRGFQSAFGKAKMSYNLHLLSHLADTIASWGPLWVHSSYPFKSYNKLSIKLVNSRKADPLQISKGYFLHTFIENISHNGTVAHTTKENVLSTLNNGKEDSPEFYIRNGDFRDFHGIGRAKRRAPLPWQSKLLKDLGFKCASKITRFNQALIKGIKYSCKDYSPKIDEWFDKNENESPTMLYTKKKDLGEIISIVSFINVDGITVNGAFVKFMCDDEKRFNAAHIRRLQETRERSFIVVDDVLAPAIILKYYEIRHAVRLAIPWE